jgi:hypothetical protein
MAALEAERKLIVGVIIVYLMILSLAGRGAGARPAAHAARARRADRDCVLAQGVLARFLDTRALGDACDAHLECADPCLELNWAKLYARFELLSGVLLRAGGRRGVT